MYILMARAVAELSFAELLSSIEIHNASVRLQYLCELPWKTKDRSTRHVSFLMLVLNNAT